MLAVPISYLNFRVHQDYYASVLCENPAKPITVCGGICYLKKQLPQSEPSESASFVSKIDISVYYQAIADVAVAEPGGVTPSVRPYVVSLTPSYVPTSFRPPQG